MREDLNPPARANVPFLTPPNPVFLALHEGTEHEGWTRKRTFTVDSIPGPQGTARPQTSPHAFRKEKPTSHVLETRICTIQSENAEEAGVRRKLNSRDVRNPKTRYSIRA